MKKLIRITTVPISLKFLITGQMKYMKRIGWDVTMISADGEEVNEVVEREGCPHIVVPLTRQITPWADIKALILLYKKIRYIKPNVVHTHTPKAGIIGMMAAWMARVPIRIHTVAGLPLESATGIKKKILLFVERLSYLASTEVWPNSQSLYQYIVNNKLTTESKLRIIGKGSSNGIDISEFDVHSLKGDVLDYVKSKFNYSSDKTYLLFVGRLVKDKGVDELIKAYIQLEHKFDGLELILVGPLESHLDPLSEKSMNAIASHDGIHAVGFSNEVKYYMHIADLFVFPSHREGFPNVLMQAALMDCPVVASRINGNVDIIDDKINGLLHQKSDEEDLIQKVDFALNNPEIMLKLSVRLKNKIKESFSRDIIQSEIASTYKQLLSASND